MSVTVVSFSAVAVGVEAAPLVGLAARAVKSEDAVRGRSRAAFSLVEADGVGGDDATLQLGVYQLQVRQMWRCPNLGHFSVMAEAQGALIMASS